MFRKTLMLACLVAAACDPGAEGAEGAGGADGEAARGLDEAVVAELRAASERYQDVQVALAEGYVPDPTGACVTAEMEGMAPELGAMGIHYLRPDLLGITAVAPRVDGEGTHTDFVRPGILIYEPQADGSLELVAIENLVWQSAWRAAGHDGPPAFQGHTYNTMVDDPATATDEAHGFQPHFDLHLWLYRPNPNGVASPFNPDVSCAHGMTMPMAG